MKKKLLATKNVVEQKVTPLLSTAVTVGIMLSNSMAYADSASAFMELVIDIIGKIALVSGVILGIVGGQAFVTADAEGDGAAKNKAGKQLGGAVGVILFSGLIIAKKAEFVAMITS